jgi:hypothetical protein
MFGCDFMRPAMRFGTKRSKCPIPCSSMSDLPAQAAPGHSDAERACGGGMVQKVLEVKTETRQILFYSRAAFILDEMLSYIDEGQQQLHSSIEATSKWEVPHDTAFRGRRSFPFAITKRPNPTSFAVVDLSAEQFTATIG